MALGDMTAYDRKAWNEVQAWRDDRLSAKQRHLLPAPVRQRAAEAGKAAATRFDDLPGADQFLELLRKAMTGLLDLITRAADASVRRKAVMAAYTKRGHPVTALDEIRALDLRVIDHTRPRLGLRYTAASAAEGAAAGLAMSGGEILAGGGAIAGAGAGAAPGAGVIAGTMAADAIAVLAAMTRVTGHIAAYYGYDTEAPGEQIYAAGVLSFGLAQQAGKSAAYLELNKLVQGLARRASWEQLNKNIATRVVRVVYERLSIDLTKNKLGQAVPVLGVALGAGLNAHLLRRVSDDADHLYRERFLREKYDLDAPSVIELVPVATDDSLPLSDIVEAELEAAEDEPDEGQTRP